MMKQGEHPNPVHDFMWAVAQMKEGKKVRRSKYNTKICVQYRKDLDGFEVYNLDEERNMRPFSLKSQDVEAADWEIVDDNSYWNLAEQQTAEGIEGLRRNFWPEDVKKCRNLILKDIEKEGLEYGELNWATTMTIIEKRFGDL